MKFTVSQSALSKAIAIVSKGLTNSTLPILSGILIRATEGTLEFQTTDLTISIRHKIPANVEEEGSSVIPGKILTNLVKNLDDAAVTFEGGERTISITSMKSTFRLNTLAPEDFPEFPTFALETSVELPCDVLTDMVERTYKVTSKDKSRPVLGGILLNVENNQLRLVATDSYRLAVCDTNVETSSLSGNFEMIIPGGAFHDALSMASTTGTILIGSTSSQVVFVSGNTTYISRRIEGSFPNYRQLLPSTCSTSVKISVADLAAALKRVSIIALANPSVKFDVDADAALLTLSAASNDQGEAHEEIGCEVSGGSLPIALNYHYVFDCVNALPTDSDVTLELQDSMKPGIFKSYEKINYLYLLMPVRM